MKGFKKGLLKKRSEILEKEKKLWLRKLTKTKALKLEESLLSSQFIWEWRKNFFKDMPICLSHNLKRKT